MNNQSLVFCAILMVSYLLEGLVMMACFPTTTTTCVILTKLAQGNEAATLFNATLSNLMGIFISPFLIYLYLHTSASIPFGEIILLLILTVLLPLCVGQLIQFLLKKFSKEKWISLVPWGVITNLTLFFVVFCVFSDTFSSDSSVALTEWLTIGGILLAVQLFLGILCFGISGLLRFPPEDRISILYASVQKTLGMGIPFINIIYEGNPSISLVYLPILVYHPLQLILGSLIASPLKQWVYRLQTKQTTNFE